MSISKASERLKRGKFIAIIRGKYTQDEMDVIAETLVKASIISLEITFTTPSALTFIERLRKKFGDEALVGAGTVRTKDQVQQAIDAGAQFTVSPNFDPNSVLLAQQNDLLHLPGVATPTEAQTAFAAGCKMLKLFPADLLGGPAYLKAICAPLNDIDFAPSGGITADNVRAYQEAGAIALGIGSWLVPPTGWTQENITKRANALHAASLENQHDQI
jgi:2-dehydro-3-deoxyphosphogluconate aldolase/(4S)-4-hydroxy-2-oxoglutarate aldolase